MYTFLISAGIASWFGFTGPLLIWVIVRGASSLAPLSKSSRKYFAFATFLRITIFALTLLGYLGFAAFYGQMTPSKDLSTVFLFVGMAAFFLLLHIYRKLEKHVLTST